MPPKTDRFHNNRLYKLLSNRSIYSHELLHQVNQLLHNEPDLASIDHPKEGSYFHTICQHSHYQKNIAFRLVYALSNAGADPNVTNQKGNTPLHEVIIRNPSHTGFDLLQALFRVGVDPSITNREGKKAGDYIKDNSRLAEFYKCYGEGVWTAIETSNIEETERLVKGFIKVDCKHNTNKSLLDKARDFNCPSIINILAEYQITNEFLHSILACDWDRATIIYDHENKSLKLNSYDSIHRLTSVRTYSKSLLEYCLNTNSSQPFEILFSIPNVNIDMDILCTDGLPFFFHSFNENIPVDIRKIILSKSNMYMKSYKGETILFHLIDLYAEDEKKEYINAFKTIVYYHPLLLTQRNQNEQTIIEHLEFTTSTLIYNKLRPFYDTIMSTLVLQLKRSLIVEELVLNNFGYYLLVFIQNKTLLMKKYVYDLLCSLQTYKGIPRLIQDLFQAVKDNNLGKLKQVSTTKSIAFYAKDSFGRTCIHLAVLHQKYTILKFICENYNDMINTGDNLNRTCYHYACIMNDKSSIEILERFDVKQILDSMNLYPSDYLQNRELCSEELHAYDFSKTELEKQSSAISNYLKLAFYPSIRKSIENNSVEEMKSLNNKITQMGFQLKDLNPNSSLNDYVQGQRYIPLLFLALEHRSIELFKYLIDIGIPLTGKIDIKNDDGILKTFKRRSQELQCLDLVDVVNNLKDEDDFKGIFKRDSISSEKQLNETLIDIEDEKDCNLAKMSKTQKFFQNLFKKSDDVENQKSKACILC